MLILQFKDFFQFLHHQWKALYEYYNMGTEKLNFFKKVRNWRNWILSVPWVSVPREKKSPWLRQYQSYISNWYINAMERFSRVATTTWKLKNLIFFFFKHWRMWILSIPRVSAHREKKSPWLCQYQSYPTLAIDSSKKRSLRVLQHGSQKIWFFFQKKFEIEFLTSILTCAEELKSTFK